MKNFATRILIVVGILVITSLIGLAAKKTEKITFSRDVVINGTVIKKGAYQISFDSDTGELSIFNGNKIVAKAPAHIVKLNNRANQTEVILTKSEGGSLLRSLTFSGNNEGSLIFA